MHTFFRVAGVLLLGSLAAVSQEPPQQAQKEGVRRVVVTFDGKLEALPELVPADFEIEAGKQKFSPARIYSPAEMASVLAIVLQDNLAPEFQAQLPYLRQFVRQLPANTYIGVFYLVGREIESPKGFNPNPVAAAETIRVPKAEERLAPPSPYPALAAIVATLKNVCIFIPHISLPSTPIQF